MTQTAFNFAPAASYPATPGYRASAPDTSRDAARSVDAGRLRGMVLDTLRRTGPMTADEVADALGESVLSIRPRVTELKRFGAIFDTGKRRANRSGKSACVVAAHQKFRP